MAINDLWNPNLTNWAIRLIIAHNKLLFDLIWLSPVHPKLFLYAYAWTIAPNSLYKALVQNQTYAQPLNQCGILRFLTSNLAFSC